MDPAERLMTLENICLDAIVYVGKANYDTREILATQWVIKGFKAFRDKNDTLLSEIRREIYNIG